MEDFEDCSSFSLLSNERMEENDGNIRKKQRFQKQEQPTSSCSRNNDLLHLGTNSQWLFQHDNSIYGNNGSSSMVLSDHLGNTPHIVESMTHQSRRWSLTALSQQQQNTAASKERCRAARRNVMRALLQTNKGEGPSGGNDIGK